MALSGPRGVLACRATDGDDPTEDARFGRVGKQTVADTGTPTRKCMETVENDLLAWDGEQPGAPPRLCHHRGPGRHGGPRHLAARMLVSVGERDTTVHDQARRATAGLPRVTVVSLPGLDHGEAIARNDLALPHVQRFLADRAP
jgi:hypothetical protein